MTKLTFAASAIAVLMATTAIAGPVEDIVAKLTNEGYTNIEIEVEGAMTEVEGELDGTEREITIHSETGEILADEIETAEEDSDDDDDSDDEDENDEKDDA